MVPFCVVVSREGVYIYLRTEKREDGGAGGKNDDSGWSTPIWSVYTYLL